MTEKINQLKNFIKKLNIYLQELQDKSEIDKKFAIRQKISNEINSENINSIFLEYFDINTIHHLKNALIKVDINTTDKDSYILQLYFADYTVNTCKKYFDSRGSLNKDLSNIDYKLLAEKHPFDFSALKMIKF